MARQDTFGERLRAARRAAGLSQADLSARSGLPKPTLSRYENDHVLPSLQTLRRLAEALGTPESVLLSGGSAEHDFYDALHSHGIEIDSNEDAQQLADDVREARKKRDESDETG